jgi:hypothetical protein
VDSRYPLDRDHHLQQRVDLEAVVVHPYSDPQDWGDHLMLVEA